MPLSGNLKLMNEEFVLLDFYQHLVLFHQDVPWGFPSLFFVVGAFVGSFLNGCIYRIPAGESILSPRSQCSCGKPIAWSDNIPIFSWFILCGRTRCCGSRLSVCDPGVEVLTASLFFFCWALLEPITAFGGMIFGSIMIAVGFIDFDHMIIPDRFSIGGFITGVVFSIVFPSLHGFSGDLFLADSLRSFIASIEGAFIGSALVLSIALLAKPLLKKEAMGFGDIKLMGAIGAFCGWQGAVFSLFGGAVIGSVGILISSSFHLLRERGLFSKSVGEAIVFFSGQVVGVKAEKQEEKARKDEKFTQLSSCQVPFGPMLAGAGIIYFLFLHEIVDNYFDEAIASFLGTSSTNHFNE